MVLQIDNPNGELVIDPRKNKERYEKWNRRIKGISKEDEALILKYIDDMENGLNVSPHVKKGARSYSRLNTLISRMTAITKIIEQNLGKTNLKELTEQDVHHIFTSMRKGKIRKADGEIYKSTADYVKVFKAFWRWHKRSNKKNGIYLPDITEDLDSSYNNKPKWVYFTVEEMNLMIVNSKFKYKVLMYLLFDSGVRAPHELVNIKGKDITELKNSNKLQLRIRDETSKTFGRKIKLMLCSYFLKQYLKQNKIKSEDFVFKISPATVNRYLTRIGKRILNKEGITMYDFRHNSACYWLPRYKSEAAIKYRLGWKKSEMIHYYTEFLGMKDTIQDDDMYIDVSKTQLENELEREKSQRQILGDRLEQIEKQLSQINKKFLLETIKPKTYKASDQELKTLAQKINENGLVKQLKELL